jgi:hypothetical protein
MKVADCTGEGLSAIWSAQALLWPLIMIYIGAHNMRAVVYPILTERLLAFQDGPSSLKLVGLLVSFSFSWYMKLPVRLILRNLRRELEMARWRIYEKACLVFIDFRSFWQKVPDLNPFELRLELNLRQTVE